MKYIILGQSVAAIKFIEQLRMHDQEAEVSVVCFDEHLPASSEKFFELVSRHISRTDVIYHNKNFYQNLRIELIQDKKITRVNLNRKTVFFDDKSRLDGDVIIIAGSEKDQFADIKGVTKEGVFSLRNFSQIESLINLITRVDTVIVESNSLSGVLYAQALASQDKEVIFCLPSECVWPNVLNNVTSNFIISLLGQLGVRVVREGSIQEVLGESDVKAVRLNIGKVIATEIVIFPDALPDVRMYGKAGAMVAQRVQVNDKMATNIEGVFAIDDMVDSFSFIERYCDTENFYADQVKRMMIGLKLLEESVESQNRLKVYDIEIAGRLISIVGNLNVTDAEILLKVDDAGALTKCVIIKNNVVQGAFLVDNNTAAKNLLEMIQGGYEIDPLTHEYISDCIKQGEQVDESQVIETEEVEQNLEQEKAAACESSAPSDESGIESEEPEIPVERQP